MSSEKDAVRPLDLPPPIAAAAAVQPAPPPPSIAKRIESAVFRAIITAFFAFHVYGFVKRLSTGNSVDEAGGIAALNQLADGQPDWRPCPNFESNPRFSCATHVVPLDHAKGIEGGVATIALSKYSVPEGKRGGKLGSVFLNPGGPGGSGHAYTFRAAPALSLILEDKYDLIGFDPRGINQTLPRMACFQRLSDERDFLKSLVPDLDSLDVGSETYLAGVRAKDLENQLIAERCEIEAADAGRHMGTTTVVRDIEYLASLIEGKDKPINFAGWSYGTVLGQYLYSMFPDRVGKVMIDGVCDIINWVESPHHEWGRSDFYDSERTLTAFYTSCAAVGPSRCALAQDNSTADSLAVAVDDALEALHSRPLIVRDAEGRGRGVLRSAEVKGWMFGKLYRPSGWGDFAKDLAALLKGDGTAIFDAAQIPASTAPDVESSTAYANPAVECADASPYPSDLTDDAIARLVADENAFQVKKISPHFAGAGVTPCPRWGRLREPERFTGPWNATLSNSVLIIGNTADPITSIKHARLAHEIQPQSALIHHDGFGHCSTAMPSLCTAYAIRNYFVHDTLPPANLTCKPDGVLFPELVLPADAAAAGPFSAMSVEERGLLEALGDVGEALHGGFRRGDGSWGV